MTIDKVLRIRYDGVVGLRWSSFQSIPNNNIQFSQRGGYAVQYICEQALRV